MNNLWSSPMFLSPFLNFIFKTIWIDRRRLFGLSQWFPIFPNTKLLINKYAKLCDKRQDEHRKCPTAKFQVFLIFIHCIVDAFNSKKIVSVCCLLSFHWLLFHVTMADECVELLFLCHHTVIVVIHCFNFAVILYSSKLNPKFLKLFNFICSIFICCPSIAFVW